MTISRIDIELKVAGLAGHPRKMSDVQMGSVLHTTRRK